MIYYPHYTNSLKIKSQDLLERIVDELSCIFYPPRDEFRKLIKIVYLSSLFRKVGLSVGVILTGEPSVGKSQLMEAIRKTIPENEKIDFTSFTPKYLSYLKEKDLSRKVIFVEEIKGAPNLENIKIGLSRGFLHHGSVVTGQGYIRSISSEVKMQNVVFITSTVDSSLLDPELLSRCFVFSISLNEEDRKKILSAKYSPESKPIHLELSSSIQKRPPLFVEIPFIEKLVQLFPTDDRSLRDFDKLRGLIMAHTFVYQDSRPKLDSNTICATIEDYIGVYELSPILRFCFNKLPEEIIEFYNFLRQQESPLSMKELAETYRKSIPTIHRYLNKLIKMGLVDESKKTLYGNNSSRKISVYEAIGDLEVPLVLPPPEKINLNDDTVLVEINDLNTELIKKVPENGD